MSQQELLAVCLGVGSARKSALSLATGLLNRLGSLQAVLQAPVPELMNIPGLGEAKVARLKALHELMLRHDESAMREQPVVTLTDAVTVRRYLQRQLGYQQREMFGVVFLDSRHNLVVFEVLFMGSINRAHVHARVILKRCLELNAAAVILAHNHPSGVAEPSQADLLLTHEVKDLCARIDVRLLDHVVVAGSSSVSMASRGMLSGRDT